MIEISPTLIIVTIGLVGGFVGWLINVTYSLGSIKSTLETELRYLREDVEQTKKNNIDHDRRIQRLEDGSHGVIGARP